MAVFINSNKFRESVIQGFRTNALRKSAAIRKAIRNYVDGRIQHHFFESPTVQSMLGGPLLADLGLEDPDGKMRGILLAIQDSIKISAVSVKGSKILFALNIRVLERGMDALLIQDEALQAATKIDGGAGKTPYIPWLHWLLEEGGDVITPGYFVKKSHPRLVGRSGRIGFMFPTNINHEEPFIIPREHQGVEGDNFVTRLLVKVEEDMERDIWRIVRPALI